MKQTYGFIHIYYGSTSGNSRKMATDFKQFTHSQGFLPVLCNIGDFSADSFLTHKIVFLFLSTYGQGGPTEDAQQFVKWLHSLKVEKRPLLQIKFVIFGLGNSTFEFFCQMPIKTRSLLLQLGAQQVFNMSLSDAKIQQPFMTYSSWKNNAVTNIIDKLHLRKVYLSESQIKDMSKKFHLKYSEGDSSKWDEENYNHINLNFEVKKYLQAQKAQVLEIRQIRDSQQGRRTLYLRIKANSTNMTPGCNIQIYPQNIIDQSLYHGSIQFSNSHILPFPKIGIKQFMKISNISSKPSKSFIQQGMFLCKNAETISKYQALLDQPYLWQSSTLTSEDVIKQLNLDLQHQASLGINFPRVYSLAGWKEGQIELIVSLFSNNGKMGLTSEFLNSRPKQLKIKILPSLFDLPKDPEIPIVMIANGSGIAPFRSILHYYSSMLQSVKTPQLYLFYGCQKLESDFYFRQEWQQAERRGIVKLHIATSREGENQYVQKIVKNKMQQFKQLLFEKKATFFICGSVNMDKDINNLFVTAHKQKGLKSYTALTKVKELQKQGRIIRQVFG